jgi:hypothetical protein
VRDGVWQTDFWEKRDSAEVVDLWEVDDDPQCGQLSDDGGEDIHGKPKPWNFVDDHATADDEHTGARESLRETHHGLSGRVVGPP